MVQPGPSDYRSTESIRGKGHEEGALGQLNEASSSIAHRAETAASDIGTTLKENPYTTVAVAAGLAFAMGALWKLGHRRRQARWETWMAQMPDSSTLPTWLKRR